MDDGAGYLRGCLTVCVLCVVFLKLVYRPNMQMGRIFLLSRILLLHDQCPLGHFLIFDVKETRVLYIVLDCVIFYVTLIKLLPNL